MSILVMKFGGTSVANIDRIRRAAKRVGREVANGHDVIVIVSAMSGETNKLVGYVDETSPLYDAREYDAIVSSGENVTARADGTDLAGNGRAGTVLARLAGAAEDHQRPWCRADRRNPAREYPQEIRRGHEGCRRRGFSGDFAGRADHHAGPRRVRHHGRCLRRRL